MALPTALSIALAIVSLSLTQGWFFGEEHEDRDPDGSLRCYQCNSSQDAVPNKSVYLLGNWRHANVTEKRNMIMQCPRSKSSFCHLVIGTKNASETIRGCSGPKYKDGKKAHIGCFFMGDEYRVCLCDTVLCNSKHKSWFHDQYKHHDLLNEVFVRVSRHLEELSAENEREQVQELREFKNKASEALRV